MSTEPRAPLRLRPQDWPVPVRGEDWLGITDGVFLFHNDQPPDQQLIDMRISTQRIFLVTLVRPTPHIQPASFPRDFREFQLPLQGDRLLIRKAYAFSSPAAALIPLPGDAIPTGQDHPMPDATSPSRPRVLPAHTADAVLLALELEERWAEDWDTTAKGGARALLKMLGPLLPPPHRPLDVFAPATRGEVLGQRTLRATARVPAPALAHALRLSGTGGLILRPFRVDGPSPHSVVWLPGNLATVLEAAASLPNACGVVANARGLGVRVLATDYPAAFATLRKTAPPPPKLYYELAGLPLDTTAEPLAAALSAEGWTATPLRTFVRSNRRVWVLQAEGPPGFELLHTTVGTATLQLARDRPPRPAPAWQRVTAPVKGFKLVSPAQPSPA